MYASVPYQRVEALVQGSNSTILAGTGREMGVGGILEEEFAKEFWRGEKSVGRGHEGEAGI